jgi:hypothetical protein
MWQEMLDWNVMGTSQEHGDFQIIFMNPSDYSNSWTWKTFAGLTLETVFL